MYVFLASNSCATLFNDNMPHINLPALTILSSRFSYYKYHNTKKNHPINKLPVVQNIYFNFINWYYVSSNQNNNNQL